MIRVAVGVLIGVPIGWLLSEVGRGWKAGSAEVPDGPPFAGDLVGVPRQPGEPDWLFTEE
ncbi:hypothetical protein LQ327_08950 [Actinomycetospora endophytica]|uniref:Uncharacterized protein n=1 Tax=Actinomycetospora endophytica TaxID=2291215 RepID=A0ABS8P907_9PSEU|nr:hypothetical protein [Actinomycetospora endophytica]MCD2193509.1 hypothetical protein [Actinomycetospora endophytica]